MVNGIFQGLFHGSYGNDISPFLFLSCIAAALLIGFLTASMYRVRNCFSRSYLITLAMLPAVVCVVILIVNGNVGTGIAVAGISFCGFRGRNQRSVSSQQLEQEASGKRPDGFACHSPGRPQWHGYL